MLTEYPWPKRWQPEAIEAVTPYVDSEYLLEIWVGDPAASIHGSLIAGYLYTGDDGALSMIHDRSGRSDVYPWPLLSGPVLRVKARLPGRRRSTVYDHPDWSAPAP